MTVHHMAVDITRPVAWCGAPLPAVTGLAGRREGPVQICPECADARRRGQAEEAVDVLREAIERS